MSHKWYDTAFMPCYIGLFMTQKAFRNYVTKHLPDKADNFCYDKDHVNATTYSIFDNGKHLIFVVMNLEPDLDEPIRITSLMAHECTHVKQYAFEAIGEDTPSPEVEAYFIQSYARRMAEDYIKWNSKRKSRMLYRKKPVEVQAVQWTGDNLHAICDFAGDKAIHKMSGLVIETLEGRMLASVGDYIIRGVKGEFYPCKPDVFELTYDEVKRS